MKRLFVAAELPAAVRAALAAAAPGAPWRALAAEDVHVTLAFLGGRPDEQVEAIADVLRRGFGTPVAARLGETVMLPPRRPRVCAVRVESPGLEAVRARVCGALAEAGLFEPEERPFLAHATVARTRERARRVELGVAAEFEIDSIALLESRPPAGRSGDRPASRYAALARTTLRG